MIGAGLSGLAAAWQLEARGFATHVCEREPQPGGRVRGTRVDDFTLDAAWPVLSSADRALLRWIDEVGLRDELLPLRPLQQAQLHRGRVRPSGPRTLLGALRTPGLRPLQALRLGRLPRLRARYARHLRPAEPSAVAALDDRSVADFGRLYFGSDVVDRWLEPELSDCLADSEQASRALLLLRGSRGRAAHDGLPRGALTELPEAAAARLPVLYEVEALRLERLPGGSLLTTLGGRERERLLETDAVVVATSAPDALRLAEPVLTSAERDFLAGVRYAPSLALAAGLRRPLHAHPLRIHVPRSERSPIGSLLLEPGVRAGRVPHARGLALARATPALAERSLDAPDDAVVKELLEGLERIDASLSAAVSFLRVLRCPRAAPRFDVGRYRALACFERVQRDRRARGRRVYLAGDYRLAPSLEGAVAAGRLAADELARDLGPPG